METAEMLQRIASLLGAILLYLIARDSIPPIVNLIINGFAKIKARRQIEKNLRNIKGVMQNDEAEISGKDD